MKCSYVVLGIILGFVAFISLRTLTSQPRYFFDEAGVVETAHNFATDGKLDIMVSPNTLSGYPHLFNATGYTVSLPLALIFKLSHVSLFSGRLRMLVWLLITIWSIFYVIRAFWGKLAGLCATALVASFAPFYGNGMQIMGEVPGFVFLIWGFYWLLKKQNLKITGLLFGLSAISKPSMYILLLPSFLIYLYFFEENRFQKLKNFIIGCVGPIVLFFVLIMPQIFSLKNWLEIINFYRNPYDSVSLFHNTISNIQTYWHHSTILYFGILLIVIVSLILKNYGSTEEKFRKLYAFTLIYSTFLVLYFLRSPGWFRYLFPLELFSLILVYPVLSIHKKLVASYVVSFLIILNLSQLFFFRGDIKNTAAQDTAAYVTNLHESVGIINAPEVSSLVPTEQRYQVIKYVGVPELGFHPLLLKDISKTKIIVFKSADNPMVVPYQNTLNTYYKPLNQIGSYRIYQLK
ncbi:MAG: glycosyltransferase family 39 protein [Patescibacteria group bacterium]